MAAESSTSLSWSLMNEVRKDGNPASYQKWAAFYDEVMSNEFQYVGYKSVVSKWQQYYNDALKGNVKQTVLDAGCGTGYIGEYIASIGNLPLDLYGGDYSPDMLEMAKKKNAYTDLRIINMKTELPYEPETFDAILSCGVFCPGHCDASCFPNLFRVLKPNGLLIVAIKTDTYEQGHSEWEKYTLDSNCEIVEISIIPYHNDSDAVVFIARKK